jgi:sigma-E factor negative regulatory protein RseB
MGPSRLLKPALSLLSKLSRIIPASVTLALLSVAPAGAETAPLEAGEILNRMSGTAHTLEYQGIFTYEHGGVLRSVKVTQWQGANGMAQKLVYLNGPQRVIARNINADDCGDELPTEAQLALAPPPDLAAQLQTHYEAYRRQDDRIAGRPVWTVHLVPKDPYRYGYALGIDQQTGLLVQVLLIGSGNRVIERFQFVDLQSPAVVTVSEQNVAEKICDSDNKAERNAESTSVAWHPAWLPAGFTQIDQSQGDDGVEQGLYSDGLSLFSIFIDPQGGKSFPDVQAQRGAMVAQLSKLKAGGRDYAICVVGEIPMQAAERIAAQISITP